MLGLDMQMSGYCANLHKFLVQKSQKMLVNFFFYLLTFLQRISFHNSENAWKRTKNTIFFLKGGGGGGVKFT